MTRTNVLVPAVALAGLAALSACSSSTPQARTPAPSSTVSSAPTTAPPTTSSTTAPPTTAPPTTAPPTPPPSNTSPSPTTTSAGGSGSQSCLTGDLTITQGGSGGAAGSVYTAVDFVNQGPGACTLDGHPGVSFVGGDDGHQVGTSAARGSEEPLARVVLQPGGEAHATLRITEAGNFPPATCSAEAVRGLRVYPPDQTASAFVPFSEPDQACAGPGAAQLTVEPVVAGPPTR